MALDLGALFVTLTVRDELTTQLQRAQQQTRTLDRSTEDLSRNVRQMGQDGGRAVNELGDGARGAVRDTNRLGDAGTQAGRQISQGAQSARRDLSRIEREASQAGQATRQIDVPSGLAARANAAANAIGSIGERAAGAANSGSSMGNSFVGGFTSRISGLGSKAGPIGIALAGVAVIGLAAGAVLAGAISDGMAREADLAKIQAGLGADDATMRDIGAAASRAYTAGWGTSMADNARVISEATKAGLLSTDDSSDQMQATTEQLQTLASVMDEDVSMAARAAGQAVKTGLVKDGAEAIDLLVKAEQKGLNVADDMLDTTIEYGTQFRQVGLSGAEAFGLMNQAVQGGARDADTAADAIKEFAIRSIDGSKASGDAYAALGMNAEAMTSKIAQGGPAAREGMAEILREVNKLEDPVKRNTVAVGLFGTKAEDLGEAMYALNLDTAVAEFGEVGGAAQRAGDIMQNTTAAKFEQSKRVIEEAMNDVKLSLAEAFGPSLQKVAEWVQQHQPEIIGFFTGLADAGFATLDAVLAFSSGVLRAFAFIQDGIGNTMGRAVELLGGFQEKVGSIIKHIPGLQSVGEAMEDTGQGVQWYGQQVQDAAGQMRSMADTIDAGRPLIQGMREDVAQAGDEAIASAEMMRALGDAVVEDIPDSKSIVISDNSPETIQRLRDLGMKVETTPNGIRVTATTDEADALITTFINRERNLNIKVNYLGLTEAQVKDTQTYSRGGGKIPMADGGVLPSQATIMAPRSRLIQWAEPETKGEAFIPLAESKRPRSKAILADVAGRFGLSLTEMADGGVIGGLTSLAAKHAPALQVTSDYRAGDPGHHGSGNAVDFSNGAGNTDEQLAWANYLADNYKSQLAELIYDDPRFDRQIKNGEFVGKGFYANAGNHTHHVHAAMLQPPQEPTGATQADTSTAPDTRTEREKIADQVIAEGKRRGISDKGIKAAVMTALAETDLQNLDYGMDGDNAGIMQQRDNGGWGTLEDRKDPARAAGMFYDKLDDFDYESMDPADAAQRVQQSGTADGSNYRVKAAEADEIIAASNARSNGQSAPATSGATSTADTPSTSNQGVQNVFVTNWPTVQAAAPAAKKRQPWLSLEMFENGGTRLPSSAGIYPDGADLVRFAEKGTGGEAYIPLAPSKRARSQQIWRDAGKRLGMQEFLDGGFGGDHGSMPETAAVTLSNKTGIQAGGAGLVGLAGLAHLAANLTQGDFNTGSAPGLTEPIKKAIEDQIEALRVRILELTGRAEELDGELTEAEAAGDQDSAARIRLQIGNVNDEAEQATSDYVDLRQSVAAPSASGNSNQSAQNQGIANALGSVTQGGNPVIVNVAQVNSGPVTINDPEQWVKENLPKSQGDPIGDAMRAVGVR